MVEKWRYRCPDCGSVQIKKRLDLSQAKEVVENTSFKKRNRTNNRWHCRHCQKPQATVYDAKRDVEVLTT